MTRKIKFRAWDKVGKKMLFEVAWIDGKLWDENLAPEEGILLSEANLMQFTGLLDCEGKELYEGDFYAVKKEPDECGFFEIIWEGCSFYSIWHIQGQKRKQILDDSNWLGINIYYIGNVYENPELIK